jgi:hypothetical protein
MTDPKISLTAARSRSLAALREAFIRQRPEIRLDANGYADDFRDTLLTKVSPEDFEADLSAGDGNELQTKFRAIHSSSGLAVNCFAPFRSQIAALSLKPGEAFDGLQFERKCPTGLRGGRSPNLDVLLSGPAGIIGIESKLSEYLSRHSAKFSPAYEQQIRDDRRDSGYFREMVRLMAEPDSYVLLDAAQLIKHAFGLAHTFKGKPTSLLYLYWEPANPEGNPAFAAHRAEIAEFAERVSGATPSFSAMSYPEFWSVLESAGPAWVQAHLAELRQRYLVRI